MADRRRLEGGCACGAVRFAAQTPVEYVVCHCEMCRRWTGSAFLAVNCGGEVEMTGPVTVWESSGRAERGSCARCGSPMYFRQKASGEFYVAVGGFDEQDGWVMAQQIFIDRKPGHFAFVNQTRVATEAECLAEMQGQCG